MTNEDNQTYCKGNALGQHAAADLVVDDAPGLCVVV